MNKIFQIKNFIVIEIMFLILTVLSYWLKASSDISCAAPGGYQFNAGSMSSDCFNSFWSSVGGIAFLVFGGLSIIYFFTFIIKRIILKK